MTPAVDLTPAVIAAVGAAAFLIGFTKAGLGGGLGPAITAIMVLALPVEIALAIQLPMLIVGDTFTVAAYWRRWEPTHLRRLAMGAIPGVIVGTYLLASVDPGTIQRFIGVISLAFVAYRIAEPRFTRMRTVAPTTALGATAGAVGAVASTVAHAGAPPVSAYLLNARVTPVEYTGTHVLLFAGINLLKVPGYVVAGFSYPMLQLQLAPTLVLLPLGVLVGRWMVARISTVVFNRLVLGVLTVTGVYLIVAV